MNADSITGWLKAPTQPPDNAAIDHALREWPWFVPARLMEAVREHQLAPFSDKVLANVQLYGDWLPAYALLTQEESLHAPAGQYHEPTEADFEEESVTAYDIPLDDSIEQADLTEIEAEDEKHPFIQPLYTEDYFRHQGIEAKKEDAVAVEPEAESPPPQTLMVVMSFAEWLTHFKTKAQKEQAEAAEKSALRSMWQQEKLAAALDDEPEEIPEEVFEMAVSSITREDDIASESLALIYERQEKWSAAAEMYRKLALKYPAKSTYFASRAEAAKKRLL